MGWGWIARACSFLSCIIGVQSTRCPLSSHRLGFQAQVRSSPTLNITPPLQQLMASEWSASRARYAPCWPGVERWPCPGEMFVSYKSHQAVASRALHLGPFEEQLSPPGHLFFARRLASCATTASTGCPNCARRASVPLRPLPVTAHIAAGHTVVRCSPRTKFQEVSEARPKTVPGTAKSRSAGSRPRPPPRLLRNQGAIRFDPRPPVRKANGPTHLALTCMASTRWREPPVLWACKAT